MQEQYSSVLSTHIDHWHPLCTRWTLISAFVFVAVAIGYSIARNTQGTLIVVLLSFLALLAMILESRWPGLFLFFLVMGYALKARDLAVVIRDLTGIPISPTEIVLLISWGLAILAIATRQRPVHRVWIPALPLLAVLAAIGSVAFLQGLHYSLVESIRPAAVIYYCLFYVFVPLVLRSWELFERVFRWVFMALGISVTMSFLPIGIPMLASGGQAHILVPIFLVFAVLLLGSNWKKYLALLPLIGLALVRFVSIDTRGVWVGMALALTAFTVLGMRLREQRRLAFRVLKIVVPGLLLVIVAMAQVAPVRIQAFSNNVRSIFLSQYEGPGTEKVYNMQIRLAIWRSILEEANRHPLYGIGLGTPYGFEWIDDPSVWWGEANVAERAGYANPHNTYMMILLRMGWPGLFAYVLIWAKILMSIYRASARMQKARLRLYLWGLWTSTIYLLATGLSQPILETPHFGVMPWAFSGAAVALINIDRREIHGADSGGDV